ncbi:MAG: hypothetical protein WCP85_16295 [Mariniphaga sp.]
MRKFTFKSLWFLLPIITLNLFTYIFYNNKLTDPDLLRLGYIINIFPNYKDVFSKEYENKIYYTRISEKPQNKKFRVLTIGDSFSEQGRSGYINYLAQNNKISVLHIDRFLSGNQIQTLFNLVNGDFFEQYCIDYVILQNVERHYIDNLEYLDTKKIRTSKDLSDSAMVKMKPQIGNLSFKFPSRSILTFTYNTIRYFFKSTFLFDDAVYKTQLSHKLFSVDNKELLFFYYDLVATQKNNSYENVYKLNNVLNELNNLLKKKGVSLIVLPSPDKYDIYFDYIVDKKGFSKPLFFEHLKTMRKEYIYIDSKNILLNAINKRKDIYYYDNTHWTPWASQLIAAEIEKHIN